MVNAYFDASALVKLIVEEPGSDIAAELWDGCDTALSSRLAYPEVCAALAAAGRRGDLDDGDLALCEQQWERYWAEVRPVELTADVQTTAGVLAKRQNLRGADAVHLASALELGTTSTLMAVWDAQLGIAAAAEGLAVVPAAMNEGPAASRSP